MASRRDTEIQVLRKETMEDAILFLKRGLAMMRSVMPVLLFKQLWHLHLLQMIRMMIKKKSKLQNPLILAVRVHLLQITEVNILTQMCFF